MAKPESTNRIPKTIKSICDWLVNALPYIVAILTFITGVAFGFGPMNTFLSVASEYTGIISSIMQCLIIIPSCFFQTILWWNAYYQPAAATMKEQLSPKTDEERQKEAVQKEIENIKQWIDRDSNEKIDIEVKDYIKNKLILLEVLPREYNVRTDSWECQSKLKALAELEKEFNSNKRHKSFDIISAKVMLILCKYHKEGIYKPNPKSKEKPSASQQRLNFINGGYPK